MKEVLMFTIFHAKITRYPLMPVQKNILFKWISHYESHGGSWLGKFPWRECRFYWSDAMAQSDVLGAASSFSGDVYLQNEATDSWAASGRRYMAMRKHPYPPSFMSTPACSMETAVGADA